MSPLDAAASAAAASPDVRDTVEYRAAWDLELWKAVQVDRFRKQLERQKNAALVRLESAIRQREKAAKVELARRAQTVTAREAAVEAAEAHLAAQQSRLAEMEKDLRRTRQQLMDAQQRVEDEVRAQVRLANDTIAHRARLLEERVNAAESQAKRAEERQRRAQQDYLTLYEAFSRARSQQLTSATTNANDLLGVSPCTGAGASTAMQLGQLRAHWDAEHQRQLDREEQRHTAEVAAMKGCCRELAEQNHRLTAALARRREQLRRVQSTACAAASAAAAATKPSASLAPAMHTTTGETPEPITRELHRLAMERISLVDGSSGAVRETDAVIVRMDSRMRDLRQQLVAAGSDNTRGDGTE
ncbi:hypothetical protein ABB37_07866 [Leptomonas pyrrhocoris]|uniref:Uncharacterized protein n=1 Tax=Leptomonas pyrrhocoris TaxID=157538 RepID=A0A0N0DSH5_LEPPY|nr:hypothetical protein ABB37_07866 [Leptomonas pyrrhocoris]KPA76088.1 hypothetical protein ABB37_07866 [Leptomonas pyrrhocoris]|eukprot:XP_015654527.1 hypothetical protein ABB37_07866 [Leptomonas pyrrhocoris]